MSTPERYLGIVAADTPATISEESEINELIHAMRKRRTAQVERTASRVPCLLREDTEGRVIHPVLGAGGEGYTDLTHSNEAIRISGKRIPGSGHVWNRDWRNGRRDTLRVTFGIYFDEGNPERIGIFVRKPDGIEWAEVSEALGGSLGYAALHAELSAAQDDGSREMRLFGEHAHEPTVFEELPFTDSAANILMGQAGLALQKGLAAS
ncbi:MAG TPA: hypothetical protein VGO07_05070 [Candidatus Saccharimonadales bacterium]|nr:hypothetical protein [Candidatus Saccharimonadales bacterium]